MVGYFKLMGSFLVNRAGKRRMFRFFYASQCTWVIMNDKDYFSGSLVVPVDYSGPLFRAFRVFDQVKHKCSSVLLDFVVRDHVLMSVMVF